MDTETIDGYERAALTIRALPLDEQAWILGNLEEPDRERVAAALQALHDADSAAAPPPAPTDAPSAVIDESSAATIGAATPEDLSAVLDEQPEWVTAVVIAECAKSDAVQSYVKDLPLEHVARLHPLARHMHNAVKPAVREVLLKGVAERLKRQRAVEARFLDFETVLGRQRATRADRAIE